ncbi:hypothetical protein [Pseudomonas mosselii]|uniref:hypothetical protein n=1 Tax=Pseudomonas mosselii TaxID=78327 RepID=UPI0021DB6C2C|nr:hypothetical protein [Pseudomonas mosselii]MCU9528068.1 hypothetical protein [Pseudomonas mosselii]MCU9535177.1 hypothetical protein [Pseudomonas mosselii]MCU9542696.1 hypothetical protein [Pseudomonas mosselii]MCU9546912.1 hypothetical protein [Pseudomonas mosselii]
MEQKIIGWRVEFEDGAVELWNASDIDGEPSFGRWVTPLIAGGPTIDLSPEQDAD